MATMNEVDMVVAEARTSTLVPVRQQRRVDSVLLLAAMYSIMDTRQLQIR